jgi:hypothetical protein
MTQKSKITCFVYISFAEKTTFQMRRRLFHHWKDSDDWINRFKTLLHWSWPQIQSVRQRYVVLSETGTNCFFPCQTFFVLPNCNHEQRNVNFLHKHANNRIAVQIHQPIPSVMSCCFVQSAHIWGSCVTLIDQCFVESV